MVRRAFVAIGCLAAAHCTTSEAAVGGWTATPPADAGLSSISGPCSMPGSVVFDLDGRHVLAGGPASAPDLSWLAVPPGFCVHHFAKVPAARQVRWSPGGELFVASPATATVGGGTGG